MKPEHVRQTAGGLGLLGALLLLSLPQLTSATDGWFYHANWPWVWALETETWYELDEVGAGRIVDPSDGNGVSLREGLGGWMYTTSAVYPWVYSVSCAGWYRIETETGSLAMRAEGAPVWDFYGQAAVVGSYSIVDTGQSVCYNASGEEIGYPAFGDPFSGQDAQYLGHERSYEVNGDGTVSDRVTGLMWQHGCVEDKLTHEEALAMAESFDLAGYDDWRLPSIKELWSLFLYSGKTGFTEDSSIPFIDTDVFPFEYGRTSEGERFIDAQYLSSTVYAGTTMNGSRTVFGVNFADGRIKGYPMYGKTYYVKFVRGNPNYGENRFRDNGDGTVTDDATNLMWMKADSGSLEGGASGDGTMTWEEALAWAESLEYAGYDDWRLPNGKELQSIVDYTRAPDAEDEEKRGPAIDPVFETSEAQSYFWTGSTHVEARGGEKAAYVCFGQAFGYMQDASGIYQKLDVHGAGSVRSDPKSGDPAEFPYGRGPQGDDIRIYNYVRAVR